MYYTDHSDLFSHPFVHHFFSPCISTGFVHYILIITLVLIVLFSQIIPCRARRDFLEHVGAPIGDHRSFMVTLT